MIDEVVIRRRGRAVQSYATGRHLPEPRRDGDRWVCAECGGRLSRYWSTYGERRLRHNPRDRR